MSIASRAAVVDRKDAPFVIRPVVVEEPRADEVLVRMVATGICATDAHVQHQLMPAPLPAILGHEGAGVVERVGSSCYWRGGELQLAVPAPSRPAGQLKLTTCPHTPPNSGGTRRPVTPVESDGPLAGSDGERPHSVTDVTGCYTN